MAETLLPGTAPPQLSGLRTPAVSDLELTALGCYILGDMDALGGKAGKGTWAVVFKSLLLL